MALSGDEGQSSKPRLQENLGLQPPPPCCAPRQARSGEQFSPSCSRCARFKTSCLDLGGVQGVVGWRKLSKAVVVLESGAVGQGLRAAPCCALAAEQTMPFTKASLPPSISDDKLERDIEISQRAMQVFLLFALKAGARAATLDAFARCRAEKDANKDSRPGGRCGRVTAPPGALSTTCGPR